MDSGELAILIAFIGSFNALGVLLACIPCRLCGRQRLARSRTIVWAVSTIVVVLWSSTTVLWFANSPSSTCSPRWMRSSTPSRRTESSESWSGFWCVEPCAGANFVRASTRDEVAAAVRAASSLRVVGSGHSTTALQCPDEGGTILSIDGFCDTYALSVDERSVFGEIVSEVTAPGGCTIEHVQRWLIDRGLELRGYGAIMSQTIAGGLATSLHGEHTSSSFGDHLVGLVAITADGSTIEVDDDTRFAWVGATGELGVVVEATLRVWPTSRVLCDRQYGSNDDVESVLYDLSVYMTSIDTIIEDGSGGDIDPRFSIRVCREVVTNLTGGVVVLGTPPSGATALLFETFGTVVLRLFSRLEIVRKITSRILLAPVEDLNEAYAVEHIFAATDGIFNAHAHSEIALPLDSCIVGLDALRSEAKRRKAAYNVAVKVVAAGKGWRTWAPVRSCSINLDFYDFGAFDSVANDLSFRRFAENLAVDELGGGMHAGKMWVHENASFLMQNNGMQAEFEALRQSLDPSGFFQNSDTRSRHGVGVCEIPRISSKLDDRAAIWRGFFWASVFVSVLASFYTCFDCFDCFDCRCIDWCFGCSARARARARVVSTPADNLPLLFF